MMSVLAPASPPPSLYDLADDDRARSGELSYKPQCRCRCSNVARANLDFASKSMNKPKPSVIRNMPK
ncbi:hypothetical protein KC323_g246 [Hortaea werneckii]|nr:hypothetical protein KC323_g246 [Hortaea werneckii]